MEPNDHVLWLMRTAALHGTRTVDEAVRIHGITASQLGVMNRLVAEPGLSGAQLARRLFITPQAAQLAVAALEERGLAKRTPDPNHGRIIRTVLTKKGRRVVDLCLAEGIDAEERWLSSLDAGEQKALIDMLRRLVHNVAVTAGSDGLDGG
jgi:DNA-binding MarR family transcriptional regulator